MSEARFQNLDSLDEQMGPEEMLLSGAPLSNSSIGDRLKATAQCWADRAAFRGGRLRRVLAGKTSELRRQAEEGYYRAHYRLGQLSRDYPSNVVLGAAAAGLLVGAGIRLWR